MFKEESSAQELFEQMQKNETINTFNKAHADSLKKIKILEDLNKAAETFEEQGYYKKAIKITRVMEKIVSLDKIPDIKAEKEKDKKDKKKSEVQMFGIFGFSPDDLKELEIDGFNDADDDWEDEA